MRGLGTPPVRGVLRGGSLVVTLTLLPTAGPSFDGVHVVVHGGPKAAKLGAQRRDFVTDVGSSENAQVRQ